MTTRRLAILTVLRSRYGQHLLARFTVAVKRREEESWLYEVEGVQLQSCRQRGHRELKIWNCAEVAAKVGISELMLPFSDKHRAKLVIYLPKTNHVAVWRHKESILCSVTGAGPCYFYRTESGKRLPFPGSFSPPGPAASIADFK